MENLFYLTDKVFIKNTKFFYESENGKSRMIQNNNWHHLLNEYGWEKLNKQWIIQLNKVCEHKVKNSLFGCLDCGGNGDCMFDCISYALNSEDRMNLTYDSKSLRSELSSYVTQDIFHKIIEVYQISKENGEFNEDWDPELINFDDFKEKIRIGGNEYWGDFLLLNLLKDLLNINFIVLNSNEITNEYYNYPLFFEYNDNLQTIILLYENGYHFKLVGYFKDNTMISIFSKETIPPEILKTITHLR